MSDPVRRAFLWACAVDVAVAKPGNVSRESDGHGMWAAQFLASAQVSAPALAASGTRVGDRIEAAIVATREAVGCNTNLGIVLLCAPLAVAAERSGGSCSSLRSALAAVLSSLDVEDARATYRAIAHANPGGLGSAPEQDVAGIPTVALVAAMRLAAHRDTIARQYANGYADVFDVGLPPLQGAADVPAAVLRCYLGWLARFPDSHIARKHGTAVAQSVTDRARAWLPGWHTGTADAPLPDATALARWDAELKTQGINPGTSADLTVASAMLAALCDPLLPERFPAGGFGMERVR